MYLFKQFVANRKQKFNENPIFSFNILPLHESSKDNELLFYTKQFKKKSLIVGQFTSICVLPSTLQYNCRAI